MAKTKKLTVDCSICKKRIEIEVSVDIAKNREYYPFEYINVHGSPEHALMIFLDQNLSVRDVMAYQDLNIAKQQKEEFASIVRMSETEAFVSIYTDPLRLKLLMILTEGPLTEEELFEKLEKEKDFQLQKFNLLILPFRKTGLISTSYLYETFYECYFLIKDFLALRIPSKINIDTMSNDVKFKPYAQSYLKKVDEIFNEYRKNILLDKEKQLKEINDSLEIIINNEFEKILRILRVNPQSRKQLLASVDMKYINELIKKNMVFEFKIDGDYYYSLLYDVKIRKFTPKYLLKAISDKLKKKEISSEMAKKHLDLLYESERK